MSKFKKVSRIIISQLSSNVVSSSEMAASGYIIGTKRLKNH